MWAYVGDVLALYDKVIADESYVRTAKRRPSLRRLVGLLGYVPRPAVAASVRLGLLADGKLTVSVPAGTAFRSSAFDGQPPQVFEIGAKAAIHPAFNKLSILPTRDTHLPATFSSLLLVASTAKVKRGQHALLQLGSDDVHADGHADRWDHRLRRPALRARRFRCAGGHQRRQAHLRGAAALRDTQQPAAAHVVHRRVSAALRVLGCRGRDAGWLVPPDPLSRSDRALDQNDYRAFKAWWVVDVDYIVTPSQDIDIGGGNHVTVPAVKRLYAARHRTRGQRSPGRDGDVDEQRRIRRDCVVRLRGSRTIVAAANTTLSATDPIVLSGLHIGPLGAPIRIGSCSSTTTRASGRSGAIDVAESTMTLTGSPTFSPPLAAPVVVHGNVVDATRGERVPFEVLGSGDASLVNQSFTLAKAPLTYLPSVDGNDTGVSSSLEIRVDGLLWTEVPTFFGQPSDAPVFTVRENNAGKAVVAFGDGVNGARRRPALETSLQLPLRSGEDVAAGEGSITQLAIGHRRTVRRQSGRCCGWRGCRSGKACVCSRRGRRCCSVAPSRSSTWRRRQRWCPAYARQRPAGNGMACDSARSSRSGTSVTRRSRQTISQRLRSLWIRRLHSTSAARRSTRAHSPSTSRPNLGDSPSTSQQP